MKVSCYYYSQWKNKKSSKPPTRYDLIWFFIPQWIWRQICRTTPWCFFLTIANFWRRDFQYDFLKPCGVPADSLVALDPVSCRGPSWYATQSMGEMIYIYSMYIYMICINIYIYIIYIYRYDIYIWYIYIDMIYIYMCVCVNETSEIPQTNHFRYVGSSSKHSVFAWLLNPASPSPRLN